MNFDVGVDVPIPMLPDPDINNMLEEAGESILSHAYPDVPEMWREADVVVVPIPTLPLLETNSELLPTSN